MQQLLKELNLFKGREEGLRKLTRYSLYHTMFYRTNLWTHTRRVAWIVEELIPLAKKVFGDVFDSEKAIALALVHDDAEVVFGDIQAGNKAKMSEEELQKIEQLERDAIENLAGRYPAKLGRFVYKELLIEAVDKTSLEYMIVSWADKYDAFGEALHELYAGNRVWVTQVENEYGKIDLPTDYYMKYFRNFESKFPRSREMFLEKNNWFKIPDEPDMLDIVNKGAHHTEESLRVSKEYGPYDQWVALTLEKGNEEDVRSLYIRKENERN